MAKTKIGIVGLGLMGGSLSLALQNTPKDYYFIGFDHNQKHCKEAMELHIVDEISDSIDRLQECDIIFLSIPVDGIISIIKQLNNLSPNTTIIDLGSTKAKISQSIPSHIRANFITAHPMTGTEKFGPSSALPNLYKNKVVVLCDMQMSGEHQKEVAKDIFSSIDMNMVFMDAIEHDRHAAFISHMPHALSYALANSVMIQEDAESIIALAGGGFRDMSRIAKSNPYMWEDIFRQNRTNLLEAIHSLQEELEKCEQMVEHSQWEDLNRWMSEANKLHDIL